VTKNTSANVMLHLAKALVSATHFILRLGVINIELLKEVTAVASMYGSVQTVNNTLGSSTAMKRTLWSTMLEVRV